MRNKKGISLIVLVITIIVMIVLASVIILSLSSTNILTKAEEAVDSTNLSEAQHLATLLWSEEYLKQQEEGSMDEQQLVANVESALAEEGITKAKYIIIVTSSGVTIEQGDGTKVTAAPDKWRANVTRIVDGVPIPKGFVASMATGENTKDTGLVIYEGTGVVTDKNVNQARFTRNQYVWVPVNKDTFDTQFIRKDFGMGDTINTTTIGDDVWEVTPLTAKTDGNLKYITEKTFDEVQKMYASVKEYGGFYIARYELGVDTKILDGTANEELPGMKDGTKVYSVMGKIPHNKTTLATDISRNIYPDDETKNTTGVVSTLTYGVQWDRTLQWFIDTNAMTLDEMNETVGSTAYGNYANTSILEGAFNINAKYAHIILECDDDEFCMTVGLEPFEEVQYDVSGKSTTTASSPIWQLTTGALKVANINNIYDMAGNMIEKTMEVKFDDSVYRGGTYYSDDPISQRYTGHGTAYSFDDVHGFRPSLYIKK